MAIIKRNSILENLNVSFDSNGNVTDIILEFNYELYDDIKDNSLTRHREKLNLFSELTSLEQNSINTLIKRLVSIGKSQL